MTTNTDVPFTAEIHLGQSLAHSVRVQADSDGIWLDSVGPKGATMLLEALTAKQGRQLGEALIAAADVLTCSWLDEAAR